MVAVLGWCSVLSNSCVCISYLLSIHPLISWVSPANLMQKIDQMYAAFTGQPLERVQQFTERDRFLSVSEVTLLRCFSLPFLDLILIFELSSTSIKT